MSDPQPPVLCTLEGPIARIRFNRPTVLNAIDEGLAQGFLAACEAVKAATDIRVVIVSGEGRAFMAGGDLASFHAELPHADRTADRLLGPMHKALTILGELAQPVIGSVQGAVAGAGFSVALSCDLTIAADNAKFGMAYARVGTCLDGGGSWYLPRLVGLQKAMEIALLADMIDAPTALALGLITRVVPADALAAETDAMAQRLASGPTFALGRIKRLLRGASRQTLPEQLAQEKEAFEACARTPDFAEGITAFLEKRPARFEGR